MSRIVDALVDRGLVTRVADPRDRRSVRIAATAEGIHLLEAGRERRVHALIAPPRPARRFRAPRARPRRRDPGAGGALTRSALASFAQRNDTRRASGEDLLMHWMLMPLRRYAEFSGRSRRKEYWMFVLLNVLISVVRRPRLPGRLLCRHEPDRDGHLSDAGRLARLPVQPRRRHPRPRGDDPAAARHRPVGLEHPVGPGAAVRRLLLLVYYISDGTPGPNRFGAGPQGRRRAGA